MSAIDRVVTSLEGTPARPWDPMAVIEAPLRLHRCEVVGAWVDYNGHMSESCFLLVFGDAADAFFRFVGIDEGYRAAGHSLYTVETHLHHHREVSEGEYVSVTLQLLGHDANRVHLFQQMFVQAPDGGTGALLASAEQMLVHVDTQLGRSSPMGADMQGRLTAIGAAHASLPRPAIVGRAMQLRAARSAT